MQKKLLVLCLLIVMLLTSGCVKGDVTMEVSRFGSTEVECKIVAVPLVAYQLNDLKNDFVQDGFTVTDVTEEQMQGFVAKKSFERFKDLGKVRVFKGIRVQDNQKKITAQAQSEAAKGEIEKETFTYQQGLLFDTVTVDTDFDLRSNKDNTPKESDWLVKNLLQQVKLRFILKLPTSGENHNATSTQNNGKTLVWNLVLGENNHLQAEVTYLNPYKAIGWTSLVLAVIIAYKLYRRKKQ